MTKKAIGIIGAIPEEIKEVLEVLENKTSKTLGMRTYFSGIIENQNVVVVASFMGKVASAITATTLINEFKVNEIIFIGTAGGLNKNLKIGDIVLADTLVQYDVDVRPVFKQFELPTNKDFLKCPKDQINVAKQHILNLIKNNSLLCEKSKEELKKINGNSPQFFIGTVISGDKFVSGEDQKQELLNAIPNVLCVEMEGAAVGVTCDNFKIPYTVIRMISDRSTKETAINFKNFTKFIASKALKNIVIEILNAKN